MPERWAHKSCLRGEIVNSQLTRLSCSKSQPCYGAPYHLRLARTNNGSLLFHEVTWDSVMLGNAWWLCLTNDSREAVEADSLRLC